MMSAALIVFLILFVAVTVLGFIAARWRQGDLSQLHEWGLGGRRFGTIVTWFLLGGDLYTAYTFVAVPALMFGAGAMGFFAVPYTILVYPILFAVYPRLWSVSRAKGYITAADFVRGRFGNRTLALAVAATGILATMPYIALQLVGMEVVIAGLGIRGEAALFIAFAILAAYTYTSGLRAPAMIAVVKDLLIYITVLAAVIIIPAQLGGYGAMTGVLSSSSRNVIRRNAAILPAYSLALGLIALLGFMAIAAGVKSNPAYADGFATYGNNYAVPALFLEMFPGWFVGVAFAAIAIGALVPAAIMSIATANLFTRNIYREYIAPDCAPERESQVAKIASLVVKLGALFFIVFLPQTYAIQLQLLGGIWIIQTLPAVLLGLYTRWLHPTALLTGWATGIVAGTAMAASLQFKGSIYTLHIFGFALPCYAALSALVLNLIVAVALSALFNALSNAPREDETAVSDYH